jgi:DNA-binding response OmpR family regulator
MAGKRVLVIDDEPEIVEILKFRLANWGYEPISATTGPEGIKLTIEEIPDAILLDVMMPGMNGFEVLQKLKENNKTKDIPVIMITVAAARADIEKGIKNGASFYLTKPYEATELLEKLRAALGEE